MLPSNDQAFSFIRFFSRSNVLARPQSLISSSHANRKAFKVAARVGGDLWQWEMNESMFVSSL